MTDDLDPRQTSRSEQQEDSAAPSEPFAGTPEQREPEADASVDAPRPSGDIGDDELEAQAAADFFHDKPAATSARVFDPKDSSGA